MVSPPFADRLVFPWLLLPRFFAELGLCPASSSKE
jgi:hypothetical protein